MAPPAVPQKTLPPATAQPVRPAVPPQPIRPPVTPQPTKPPAAPHRKPAGAPALPKPAIPPTAAIARGGMISLNFDDADVYSVVQTILGDILRVNYVVDPRVKGRVTFRSVAPVPSSQVLPVMEVILRVNGIGIVEESGLYRVVPISEIAREPAQVTFGKEPESVTVQGKSIIHIIPIAHLQSTEVVKLLTPFFSTSAVAIDMPNTNQIVLVDTDANVRRILHLLAMFDNEATKKKKPQVFVYHVQNSKAKDVANILQQIFFTGQGGSSAPRTMTSPTTQPTTPTTTRPAQPPQPPQTSAGIPGAGSLAAEGLISASTRFFADETMNSIVVFATPNDYEVIKDAIGKVDIIPRQVILEGVVAQIDLKDDFNLGVAWAIQYGHYETTSGTAVVDAATRWLGFNVQGTPNTTPIAKPSSSDFTFVGTVGKNLRVAINTLATKNLAKLLASPYILVSDNKEARIQIGKQVPIATSETIQTGTTPAQRTIQYKDIGIILKVKPRINEGGLVALELTQEVSDYETIKLFNNEDNVIVKKTEATTSLVVQDGQTIIIGGLIQKNVTDNRSGIPFFRDLPLVGPIFGTTTKNDDRSEIIILLTPRVIKNQKEAQSFTTDYIDSTVGSGRGKIHKNDLLGAGRRKGTLDKPKVSVTVDGNGTVLNEGQPQPPSPIAPQPVNLLADPPGSPPQQEQVPQPPSQPQPRSSQPLPASPPPPVVPKPPGPPQPGVIAPHTSGQPGTPALPPVGK